MSGDARRAVRWRLTRQSISGFRAVQAERVSIASNSAPVGLRTSGLRSWLPLQSWFQSPSFSLLLLLHEPVLLRHILLQKALGWLSPFLGPCQLPRRLGFRHAQPNDQCQERDRRTRKRESRPTPQEQF